MRFASLLEEDNLRIFALMRPLPTARDTAEFERRQVTTLEEADQVRGTDDDDPVHELHAHTLPAICVSSCVTSGDYHAGIMADKRPDSSNPRRPPSSETLIDKQIREAQEAGAFDDLPHQGERLPLVDDSAAGDWALAYRMLKGSNFAPPWIETDKDVRALLAEREVILARATRSSVLGRKRDETELRRVVAAANDAIFRLNLEAPTPRQQRRPLDLDAELAALASAHADRD